jgi:hypothetical protein
VTAFAVTLPHGIFDGAARRQEAVLRPPTGADEAFLLEDGHARTRAERVTTLLSRCLARLGGGEAGEEAVRALTVGDREALLLHLRAAVHGDRLACVLDCPDCGARMDLDLRVSGVLLPPYPEAHASYETTCGSGRARFDVRFRLPTGADQEAAARAPGVEAGATTLLERCVDEVRARGRRVRRVPDPVADELPALMARLDPQAEVVVNLACPECGTEVSVLLDAATILFRELTSTNDRLYREVHAIALHYHWSEREILGLDVQRRRRYLELIADAVDGT